MKMKRTVLYIAALVAFPAVSSAQLYVEPEQNVDCSVFIEKERGENAQQGLEIWDRYVFALEDGGHVRVFDFRTASGEPVAKFDLASARPDNHANNASFGIETAPGGSFPLLYVTNGKVGSEIEMSCFVESIKRRGRKFSSEIVQTIKLDTVGWRGAGYAGIFGAPSWMVDRDRSSLWVFSARKRTIHKVTRNAYENQYVATKFRVPALAEGKVVTLGLNDIEDQVVFPFDTWFTQAGCVKDGKIYYCFGLGERDASRPSRIRVYDTDTRTMSARYELQEQIPVEMEDIAIVDGWMYVNTNTHPKQTNRKPCIYKVSLPKPKPQPQTYVEELRQCPEKAGGVYYVEDFSDRKAPAAPEGYKPFYINGFFRHGARQVDDNITYASVYGSLALAESQSNLTGLGKAVYERLKPFRKNIEYREADLTQLGWRQSVTLGERMVDNYPEVFEGQPYMRTRSTNVLRTTATMMGLVQGITSRRPDLKWNEVDNSRAFLQQLNPYGTVCPGRLKIDADIISGKGFWREKYEHFRDSLVDVDAFMSRLFISPEKNAAEYDPHDLEFRFYLMAGTMQCLDRQVPLWDVFTEEEILSMAQVESYKYYAQKGPEPVTQGRGSGLAARTLKHILTQAKNDIDLGRTGIDLSFGHDGTLLGMMANLGSGTWGKSTSRPEEAIRYWQNWNIPMGTNLQLVFYRSAANPEILVRMMLNEKDLPLPLTPVQGNYYKWNDVLQHYLAHCDAVEKSLEQTKNINY